MVQPTKILDALLVISYRSGNKKALGLLVERWNKKLCVHAYRYTKDWEMAKDVTQDTWQVIMAKIHFLKDTNSFGSWALTIVGRKAINSIKKGRRLVRDERKITALQEDTSEEFKKNENHLSSLSVALSNLPPEQQMVLRLFYLEAYSIKEISEITQVSRNTVKTRLFRGRENLRKTIKK